jgi:glycerate 2-kinase
LVCPDKFKGTYSAPQIAEALASGFERAGLLTSLLPVADGGEGTMQALVSSLGGEIYTQKATGPLATSVDASFALLADETTAVVETAQASGLGLVPHNRRDPWQATTRGTGELIASAQDKGAKTIIVCVGGSATTDGGSGAVSVLKDTRLKAKLKVACDVRSKWEDAAILYGPQKGADSEMVQRLTKRLDQLAAKAPKDPRGLEGTGCAGGLSGALWAYFDAQLIPGANLVLDTVGFDALMSEARFVVTGEGKLDQQTLEGKAVSEIATRCRQAGCACHAVVGENALSDFYVRLLDLASVREASTETELSDCAWELASSYKNDGRKSARR